MSSPQTFQDINVFGTANLLQKTNMQQVNITTANTNTENVTNANIVNATIANLNVLDNLTAKNATISLNAAVATMFTVATPLNGTALNFDVSTNISPTVSLPQLSFNTVDPSNNTSIQWRIAIVKAIINSTTTDALIVQRFDNTSKLWNTYQVIAK